MLLSSTPDQGWSIEVSGAAKNAAHKTEKETISLHPLFIEQLARCRQEELEREAAQARFVSQARYRLVKRREQVEREVQNWYSWQGTFRLLPRIMLRWIGAV